jgi:hypothetical protein
LSSFFKQRGKGKDIRSLIKEIVGRVNKLETQINEIQTLEFGSTVRSNNDRIAYICEAKIELNAVVVDPNLKDFQLPAEPDGKYLTCWMNMDVVNNGIIADASGFGNDGTVSGTIVKQNGQVADLYARQFDTSEGGDKIRIRDSVSINTFSAGLTTGFSVNFSISPISTTLDGDKPRVIACKTDDSTTSKQQGWIIWVDQDNNLYFHVRIANVYRTALKISAFPALNNYYRVVCTYDRASNTPKIYVQGAVSTDPLSTTFVSNLALPGESLDLYIGGTDETSASRTNAMIADFRYWKEIVLSQTQVENLQSNGYSITAIPYPARVGTALTVSTDPWCPTGPGGDPGTPPSPPPPPTPPPPGAMVNFESANFESSNFA